MKKINEEILGMQHTQVKREYPVLFNDIKVFIEKYYINLEFSFREELYLYINELTSRPTCQCCDNNVRFKSITKGYVDFCSNACVGVFKKNMTQEERDIVTNKRRATTLAIYGVDNVAKNEKVQDKIKDTNIEKYGTYFPLFNEDIKKKRDDTNMKNWGGHPLANKDNIIIRSNNRRGSMNEMWCDSITELINQNKYKYKILKYNYDNRSLELECHMCNHVNDYTYDFIKNRIKINASICLICNPIRSSNVVRNLKTMNKYDNLKIKDVEILSYKDGFFECSHITKEHDFTITRAHLRNRNNHGNNICTICHPISEQQSIKENEIIDWLDEYDLTIVEQDRNVLFPKELDIYIPSHNLAIELNGLYFHSEHHKDEKYHLDKSLKCQEKGIHLIHIWEDEWVFKHDIIKSIIKNRLGLIENKIYARKCDIRVIDDNNSVRIFLDENHIQGFCGSTNKLGLFYNNELVSLMTFGVRHTNSKQEMELIRFCNKLDTNVIGAASKLFKYFTSKYKFNSIISYSDFRMFDGKLYENLGFEKIHLSKPNYYWCKNLERKHRFTFNKQQLVKEGFDSSKTEVEIMHERKWFRVYGCGQVRWEYYKKEIV